MSAKILHTTLMLPLSSNNRFNWREMDSLITDFLQARELELGMVTIQRDVVAQTEPDIQIRRRWPWGWLSEVSLKPQLVLVAYVTYPETEADRPVSPSEATS
jgi:hypothetical protein